jgi:hypothetical protein
MYRARIAKKPDASIKKNLLGKCENAHRPGNIDCEQNPIKNLRNRCYRNSGREKGQPIEQFEVHNKETK